MDTKLDRSRCVEVKKSNVAICSLTASLWLFASNAPDGVETPVGDIYLLISASHLDRRSDCLQTIGTYDVELSNYLENFADRPYG